MRKNIEIYLTIGGSAIVGDADDELAPLMKIEFCNELSKVSDDEKIKAVKGALAGLGFHESRKAPLDA
jgi:hypothetical protein